MLGYISTNPIVWFSMLMSYRNHKNMIFFYGVQQFVWEFMKEALSYIAALY